MKDRENAGTSSHSMRSASSSGNYGEQGWKAAQGHGARRLWWSGSLAGKPPGLAGPRMPPGQPHGCRPAMMASTRRVQPSPAHSVSSACETLRVMCEAE